MKKYSLRILAFMLLISLSSCYSFNRIEIKPNETNLPIVKKLQDKTQIETNKVVEQIATEPIKKDKIVCPIFAMPALPRTPELPYKELSKIPHGNTKAMLELQQDHIEDLRAYIVLVKQLVQKSQIEHIQSCQNAAF